MELEGRCYKCKWFSHDPDLEEDEGLCCRFPPTVSYSEESDVIFVVRPRVDWLDFCGEFLVKTPITEEAQP